MFIILAFWKLYHFPRQNAFKVPIHTQIYPKVSQYVLQKISQLLVIRLCITAQHYKQLSLFLFVGAIKFARSEGLIPAPEPTHAIAATIREALRCRETGESKVILTAMCGHGHFDLPAYEKYLQGGITDLSFANEKMKESLTTIPQVA